jgi:RNA polymerase sigma-70 factor (ECF subfamily)
VARKDASGEWAAREDRDLVRQCLEGSAAAFEEIVRRYQAPLLNLATRIIRDHDEAQDIAQEAFVKAYGALGRYDPVFPFRVWLFKIVYNVAIDHVRRRRTGMISLDAPLKVGGEDLAWELPDAGAASPLEAAEAQDQRAALNAAMEKLPPALRAAIVLRHVEDLSYEEIASTLGIPLGTVKIRIHRGREALGRILRRTAQSRGDERDVR